MKDAGVDPTAIAASLRWRSGADDVAAVHRTLAEEAPVALVHDGSTTAVMMATPADLEELGLGFSLTERIVAAPDEVRSVEVVSSPAGHEVRMWLTADRTRDLAARRRHLAGPTGCGLCGIESLVEAVRPPPIRTADEFRVGGEALLEAMAAMSARQALGAATRSAHAAAFWAPGEELLIREDVGRHNALDKLVGAMRRLGRASSGVVLLTSRVSVEMVQKAAVLGAPVLCAVSAPTALAVRTAQAAGLTLIAVARQDGFEVFSHPDRLEARMRGGASAASS